MTVVPQIAVTRDQWIAARDRMREAFPQAGGILDKCMEAALGPCPPPPEQIIERLATWIEDTNPGVEVNRMTGLVIT